VRHTRGEESWPLSEVQLLAPVPDPGTIYAIGLNYADSAGPGGAAMLALWHRRLPFSPQIAQTRPRLLDSYSMSSASCRLRSDANTASGGCGSS